MSERSNAQPCHIVWQGIAITLTHEPNWLNLATNGVATSTHLSIAADSGVPLPISETGYKSSFVDPADIDAAGGPAAYVVAWLDYAAQSREWKASQRPKQLSLF